MLHLKIVVVVRVLVYQSIRPVWNDITRWDDVEVVVAHPGMGGVAHVVLEGFSVEF